MNNIINKVSLSVFGQSIEHGNPTTVYELSYWPSESELKLVVFDDIYDEITFFTRSLNNITIRWFSKTKELPLCGHGALAVAHILYNYLPKNELIKVSNLNNKLWLYRDDQKPSIVLKLNNIFPYMNFKEIVNYPFLSLFNCGRDLLMLVENYENVMMFDAGLINWKSHNFIGFIVASKPSDGTVYFRFFAPLAGIFEDKASASVIPSLIQCSILLGFEVNDLKFTQLSGFDVNFNVYSKNELVYISGNVLQI